MIPNNLQKLDEEYDQVFIIDCLPEEEYSDWAISQDLMQYLADKGIRQTTSKCRDKKLVIATLVDLINRAKNGEKFYLHIVSHGDDEGLWVKSVDETIIWEELTHMLQQINDAMGGTLMINMTSCFGLHGIKIVNEHSNTYPFFGLIGYSDDLEVDKGKLINRLFYNKILNGKQIQDAVMELKAELPDDKLFCISSEGYKLIRNKLNRYK